MKVLIVGGTGVISTAVVNEAVAQGVDLTCINRGNNHGNKLNPNVKVMHFDVRNRKVADDKLAGMFYDVVVDFICFNANQVRYSLELFQDKCKQYVFISTDSVYKLQKDGHYDETTPQSNPEWNYSYEKAECEDIVRTFCKEHNLIYTIVRPSITYGNTRIPYGFMPPYGYHYTLIERIKAGKPIVTWNKGKNYQTVMRVEDFATGMVGLWGNPKAYNNDYGICGDAVTWSEILDAIETKVGIKVKRVDVPVETIIKELPWRKGEFLVDRAEDHIVSNRKLREDVPLFAIKFDINKGVATTIDYYQENNMLLGIDYQFDGQMDRVLRNVMGGVKTAS
ncbi:MAG: NAD-dependent epimerase/dehydratase family protein [Bacteroidaceae bacterium]|nr:NAD-dependent epimerase/dehydratase family protein [Bacteroidaceae bacterium]